MITGQSLRFVDVLGMESEFYSGDVNMENTLGCRMDGTWERIKV